jgi:hypothetical protein
MYAIGLYMLPKGVHGKMDSNRSKFFWQGLGTILNTICLSGFQYVNPRSMGGWVGYH